MNSVPRSVKHARRIAMNVFTVVVATHAFCAWSQEIKVALSGNQEIPPVTTSASGTGTLAVNADRSVTGSVTITGMSATVAHIHEAAAGANGLIIVPLVRSADNPNLWSVPPGAKLTDAQYESYKAGNLYFNIHSVANRGGEIRGQIKL